MSASKSITLQCFIKLIGLINTVLGKAKPSYIQSGSNPRPSKYAALDKERPSYIYSVSQLREEGGTFKLIKN